MYIIGENIHIISPRVKKALAERDAEFFKASAIQQVEAGASAVDLNLGRQKNESLDDQNRPGSSGCPYLY
jgi:5-methyltetrahydrofolate corrinoid/iron sulfur protein methyltransferase